MSFSPIKTLFAKKDGLRISILKMPYLDTYDSLHRYSQSVRDAANEGQPGTVFSDDIEYRQPGMRSVEFSSEYSNDPYANLLNLHKVIATGFSPSNYMGIVSIVMRKSLLKEYDKQEALEDLELWRKRLRDIRFIDWENNKSRPELNFKTMIINVLKQRRGAKIAIPVPESWTLESREESDKSIKFSFSPKQVDPLIGESILLIVRKDYFKNDYQTITAIEKGMKERLEQNHPGVRFSDRSEYLEGNNQMIEYTSSYLTEDNKTKVILLDKLITTGSESNNNLGLIIVSKVFTTLKEMDLRTLEPEIDLYRQQIRKIRLLKWDLDS